MSIVYFLMTLLMSMKYVSRICRNDWDCDKSVVTNCYVIRVIRRVLLEEQELLIPGFSDYPFRIFKCF